LIAASRRPSGPIARLVLLALLAAGCGATVPSIESSRPTPTRPAITPAPTTGKFVATAYPADGDAPCRQKAPPDTLHGAYTGNLKRISARDARTVVFELCSPDVAFLAKIADPAFGINDTGWLTAHIDPGTTGAQPITTAINGTGPYRLEAWDRGAQISLARNDGYWGHPALNERSIVRWNPASGERVGELQAGTVDGIDEVAPDGVEAIDADVSTVGAPRDGLEVVYLGFSNTTNPFGNEAVRRALALGIDRRALIARYLPPGAVLSTHAAPCVLPYACTGGSTSDFDPALAKETLTAAGYANGFLTKIHYSMEPTAAIPDPSALAAALQAQLETNLAISAELVPEPEATYRADVNGGTMDGIHILAQEPGYPDVSASLDPRLATGTRGEAGKPYDDIVKALATGRSTANGAKREAAYKKANDLIRAHVPLIPLAAVGTHAAFLADVTGGLASPLHQESFALMTPSDRRQLVWLTTGEPDGLYCADEVGLVARLVCGQIVESLYTHEPGGAAVLPSLAEKCSPDGDLVTWTCTLRKGVLFGDGARLDANDVVLSMAVQWDAEHPLHLGRTGDFATFRSLFGGYLHPPPG
jgi:peptide/nickel transport system substrate-binding protein